MKLTRHGNLGRRPQTVDVLLLCGAERGHINILFLTGGELDFLDGAVPGADIPPSPWFQQSPGQMKSSPVSRERSYKADILPPDNKTRTRRLAGSVEKITP